MDVQPVCVCVCRLDLCFCFTFMNYGGRLYSDPVYWMLFSTSVHLAKEQFWAIMHILMWYISIQCAITVARHIPPFPFTCSPDPHRLQFPKVTGRLKGRLSGLLLTNLPQGEWGGGWNCCWWGCCSEPNCCHVMGRLTRGQNELWNGETRMQTMLLCNKMVFKCYLTV